MRDAVPVAGHRLEGVIHRDRRIAEMLDLLQHRVGPPVGENVTGQKQHRQAVGMGTASRRHHVQSPRTDRRQRDHDLPPPLRLGKAHRRQCHRLFVLPAPRRQLVLHRLQRFRQAGHVAVTEYAEEPGKQWFLFAVDNDELVAQIAHQRLRHGQTDRGHIETSCCLNSYSDVGIEIEALLGILSAPARLGWTR